MKYAVKSGRIPTAAVFFGTKLNLKPLMKIFDNGITTAAKCRGERKPEGLDFVTAAAIPLTGLSAYQAITEELCAKPGETVFIPGGSGSLGQMTVPIAKAPGLRVIVSVNVRAKDVFLSAGADQYIVYTEENYWETLSENRRLEKSGHHFLFSSMQLRMKGTHKYKLSVNDLRILFHSY